MSLASTTPVVIEKNGYALTNHRALCRRGVLWIGQTCNLRCHFCYFLDKIMDRNHPEHDFFELEKLKAMCKTLVDVYGNNSVDIQGGEPTIYRHLPELLHYCNEIGLKPTLITNGQVLANPERVQKLKEAGVYDLLISVHGLGARYDKIVVVNGAAVKLQKAISNIAEAGIPFRFNCVLCTDALPDLMSVAKLAVEKGARAVNYIAFNPFIDQACGGKRSAENVPKYSDVLSYLLPVLDYLEENHVEANVRYLPFCLFPEKYRKYVQNFQQIVYDLHEWESAGEVWSSAKPQRETEAPLSAPIDFFRHIEGLRLRHFRNELSTLPADERWGSTVSDTLSALEARASAVGPLTVYLYGSAPVGNAMRQAIDARPALARQVTFKAFVSSARYRTADMLDGLAWITPEQMNAAPQTVILNTSESSRAAITETLRGQGLENYTIEVFGQLGKAPLLQDGDEHPIMKFSGRQGYRYAPYLPELGALPEATVLEQAYKEFRVLMPKTMHPYAKGDKCNGCSLRGICDGFHKDYAELFGFDEAIRQEGEVAVHPCHYSKDQLKVVEAQEFSWALPAEHPLARAAQNAASPVQAVA